MTPELKAIHYPAEISIWPIAPAWWVIIALFIGIVAIIVWYKGSTLRAKKHLFKLTLHDTQQALLELKNQTDHLLVLQSSNQIIKKFLINLTRDKNIAQLHHNDWIAYCENVAKPFTFRKTTQYLLSNALYQPELAFDIKNYIDELQLWLKHCTKNV